MRELHRQHKREDEGTPTGGLFSDPAPVGNVTVIHGAYTEDLPLAQMTVGQVRDRFGDRFDIHPGALALVGGHPVDDGAMLLAGQRLMFIRPAGEKGWLGRHRWETR